MSDNPDPRLDEIQAIPAEAVEAAARVMAPTAWGPRMWHFIAHGETPTEARDRVQRQALQDAREALEAAHPGLLAELRKAHEALERVEALARRWETVPALRKGTASADLRAAVAAAKGDERG